MPTLKAESFTDAEYAELVYAPRDRGVFIQHHRPTAGTDPYHFHPSIEINFLQRCNMIYSFSGQEVAVEQQRFCVFWAAHPHRVTRVNGNGSITNMYISLSEFLHWKLPNAFTSAILSGSVITSGEICKGDTELVERWAAEAERPDEHYQRLHSLELQSRLFRLGIDGWDVLLEGRNSSSPGKIVGGNTIEQFERMLRFVASYYANPIKISDVAREGGVSTNYAITIFRKMLGRTIKEHITDMRLVHARMLLVETDSKILTIAINSGFGSQSAFYEAFQNHTGVSPAAFRKGAITSIADSRH